MDINIFNMYSYNCPWHVTGKYGDICLASGSDCYFNECAITYWIKIQKENKGEVSNESHIQIHR